MFVKLLLDMNLSPMWAEELEQDGIFAVHWRTIGRSNAPDSEIFEYAREHDYTVFTHDLDFSAILFHTGATAPSVVQLRCEDTRPAAMKGLVISALRTAANEIARGCLLTIDPRRNRLHLLPLGRKDAGAEGFEK